MNTATHQVKSGSISITALGWLQCEIESGKCLSILNYKWWKSGRLEITLEIHSDRGDRFDKTGYLGKRVFFQQSRDCTFVTLKVTHA